MKYDVTLAQLDELITADKAVIIDFYAQWCGPCKMFSPIYEKVAAANEDKVEFVKLDVDAQPEVAAKYGIQSVPTVIAIKGGEIVHTSSGIMNEPALTALVGSLSE